ncbi:MAG TPA: ACT domain-containing protein [Actinomycetales bacterium]|jgi:glycine cleavage system transcriptional repressor
MALLAVTVLGRDRPGIVADATAALAGLGGNLEDSTMTLLRGHFAMLLLVQTPAATAQVEQALASLGADGSLTVDVRAVPAAASDAPVASGAPYVLSVHGADRPGIVGSLTGVVAAAGGNVVDLSTRLTEGLYVLLAEVHLGPGTDVDALLGELREAAEALGVDVSLRPLDTDDL